MNPSILCPRRVLRTPAENAVLVAVLRRSYFAMSLLKTCAVPLYAILCERHQRCFAQM